MIYPQCPLKNQIETIKKDLKSNLFWTSVLQISNQLNKNTESVRFLQIVHNIYNKFVILQLIPKSNRLYSNKRLKIIESKIKR